MKRILVLLMLIIHIFSEKSVNSAKILGVFPIATHSHQILGVTLLKSLAARGHQVTMASPFLSNELVPNFKRIHLEGVDVILEKARLDLFNKNMTEWSTLLRVGNSTNAITEQVFKCNGMQELLNSNEHFDLIIFEAIRSDAFVGLKYRFNAPIIAVSTFSTDFVNHFTGNIAPYSFVPNNFVAYNDRMTFVQSFYNTVYMLVWNLFEILVINPTQEKLYEMHFKDAPDFQQAIKNVDLIFVNSHVLLETPRPYMPNMIQIGGLHVQEPKQLPSELQEYLDTAAQGAIYFSLGSYQASSELPEEICTAILNTFRKLPQKIIWKFESENLAGLPDNVKIGKWFPQNDILAHRNVKLFITHGGFMSTTETVFHGVPVLGIPLFADQSVNVFNLVTAGYGAQLQIGSINEVSFLEAIQEVLNNTKYYEKIKRGSEIIKDQPMKPLDRAIFWTEFLIKHKSGKHFRSASLDLSLIQYLLLDVILFVCIVLAAFVTGSYLLIRKMFYSKNNIEKSKIE